MSRKRRRNRRPNSGSFQKGPDPRRHVFTRDECRLGLMIAYATAAPEVALWLRDKVRSYYRERDHGKQTQETRRAG
jgi:hypothetical protein